MLEEGNTASTIAEIADVSEPLLGGTMGRGEPGLWINSAVGCALRAEPLSPGGAAEAVGRLRGFYEPHGIEPRIELAPFAAPSFTRALADEGFVIRNWETIFFREVGPGEQAPAAPAPLANGLRLGVLDPRDALTIDTAAELMTRCFAPPGHEPTEAERESVRRSMRLPRTTTVMARDASGVLVAAACMAVHGPVAPLFGAITHPDHRRRGLQQHLLAFRLGLAAQRGVQICTIGCRPGVATERNARRLGFQAAYTKVVLVRPGAGLTPMTM